MSLVGTFETCPLFGANRKWLVRGQNDAFDPQETFAEPRGPVTAITKCLIWVPSVTRVTVAARELRQFGRTSERMVRPQEMHME
jgi:hypothetical protein